MIRGRVVNLHKNSDKLDKGIETNRDRRNEGRREKKGIYIAGNPVS